MLTVYVVLDGFDFGAGILHLFVAKTDDERRTVFAAIGPFWDGNEVWLVAAGGVLVFAFPRSAGLVHSFGQRFCGRGADWSWSAVFVVEDHRDGGAAQQVDRTSVLGSDRGNGNSGNDCDSVGSSCAFRVARAASLGVAAARGGRWRCGGGLSLDRPRQGAAGVSGFCRFHRGDARGHRGGDVPDYIAVHGRSRL